MLKKIASCVTTVISMILVLCFLVGLWQSHVEDGGIALIAQGNVLVSSGDPVSLQKAVAVFKKAAATFHDMHSSKEARNESRAYYNMARAYHALKQNEQAIDAAQRALPLCVGTDAQTRIDAGDTYYNLGIYYIAANQPEKALDACLYAKPLLEASGLQDRMRQVAYMEGALRYDQTTAAAQKRDWARARDICIQAQQLYHKAAKPLDEADAYHELSVIYEAMGDAAHAAEAHQQEQGLRPVAKGNTHR